MPRFSSAITGMSPTNASEKNENVNSVSRMCVSSGSRRAMRTPESSRCEPALVDVRVRATRVRRPQQPDDREEVRERVDREHRRRVERARRSAPPIAGPITRDRFICTDVERDRAGQVFAGHERRQDRAQARARRARSRCRSRTRDRRSAALRRIVEQRDARRARTRAPAARAATLTRKPAPVDDVGEQPAERRQEQQRAELREEHEADEASASRSA